MKTILQILLKTKKLNYAAYSIILALFSDKKSKLSKIVFNFSLFKGFESIWNLKLFILSQKTTNLDMVNLSSLITWNWPMLNMATNFWGKLLFISPLNFYVDNPTISKYKYLFWCNRPIDLCTQNPRCSLLKL